MNPLEQVPRPVPVRAERRVRGARTELIEDLVPYGIFTTDTDLRVETWNTWMVTNSGMARDSVIGRTLPELFPALGENRIERLKRALAGEVSVMSAALHKHLLPLPSTASDDPRGLMLQTARIAPLHEDGHIVGLIATIDDVTQREMQAVILQRQQELDRLLSSALATLLQSNDPAADVAQIFPTIMPVLGLDTFVSYLLETTQTRFHLNASSGFSPRQRESLATLPLSLEDTVIATADAPSIPVTLARHAEALHQFGVRAQCCLPLVIGNRVIGLISFASYQRAEFPPGDLAVLARIARYVAIALDRTMREREVMDASRAKDEFLAALSHELRTPLNPVLLLASDSATNPEFSPAAREVFRVIEKNVLLEARLIDDLLDLTRIERGKTGFESQLVDVHAVLQDAIVTVRADAAEQRLSLLLDLQARPSAIMADAGRLQQVFWNVLKNAIKFTPAGGEIRISTAVEASGKELRVQITDTGIGLEPHEMDRIFGAFAQGDHAGLGRGHRFGGLGLGLAISRKLVELHSGRIAATSRGRGQGSTFTIWLPLAEAGEGVTALRRAPLAVDRPHNPESSPAASNAPVARVLLVEDHAPTRESMARLLIKRGFDTVAVGTAGEALEQASAGSFDLVLSDIGLPDSDGFTLMASLRDRFKMKGIALTGYGMENDIERSNAAGFVAHLTKPISVALLDNAVSAALAQQAPGGR